MLPELELLGRVSRLLLSLHDQVVITQIYTQQLNLIAQIHTV